MDTSKLRKFAQFARTALVEQVEVRLKSVLAGGSLARRESAKGVEDLEKKIKKLAGDDGSKAGERRMIEMAAYTWFNRFCALRYMDVNRYTRIGVISPADGQFQPEILAEAKMGHMDEDMIPQKTREKVNRLLDETDPSDDPQGEAYRLLLVAACNHFHSIMPFMFEKIADYTELLLPDDLLSGNSVPAYTREALLPINCSPEHTDESVEVIGWLYQFYISEKKDDVFAALKRGKKITPENIPAATQLFTPHWIVRYLVENSLGRLWMLNHPDSRLIERMDYYIKPEPYQPEASARTSGNEDGSLAHASGYEEDFLKISSPEEIKICDPACGSGHMLTYAFDLLYAIYDEQGYQPKEIPQLILKHNLLGVEIDDRAGALAAFALTMKAREKDRRFFTRKPLEGDSTSSIENQKAKIQNPNICVLENISIDPEDLSAYMDKVGRDLFSGGLQGVVNQWEEADNFGSLIRPLVTDVGEILEALSTKEFYSQDDESAFLAPIHQQVLTAMRQADYLSPKYHVVVANPPYMGSKGMNGKLSQWTKKSFPNTKADLFGAFIERNRELSLESGFVAMITMQSWMFLSSFEDLRLTLVDEACITTMAHLGPRAFDTIGGEVVSTTAFVLCERLTNNSRGRYLRLIDGNSEQEKEEAIREAVREQSNCDFVFDVHSSEFKKIPGSPIAYWAPQSIYDAFDGYSPFNEFGETLQGMTTCDNDFYIRYHWEVSGSRIARDCTSRESAKESAKKWFPYTKGGAFRKWYGNDEHVVNWEDDGRLLRTRKHPSEDKVWAHNFNLDDIFKEGATYSSLSSSSFGCRYTKAGSLFDQNCTLGDCL